MRSTIFRVLAGAIGLFFLLSAFAGPGARDPLFLVLGLMFGGILLYYAGTGKSLVSRESQKSE